MVAVAVGPGFVELSTRGVVKLEPGGFSIEVQPCGKSWSWVRDSPVVGSSITAVQRNWPGWGAQREEL
jgi:hypothetical protein